jgi:hypothetical protein
MIRKILVTVALAIVVLLAIGGLALYLAVADPMEDMRHRADALPIPSDFVLVSESYGSGGFNTAPKLERVYHASWLGLCDSLRSIHDRAGGSIVIAQPRGYERRICDFASSYPAGWRGWVKNFWHYDLRLYAWDPGLVEKMPRQWPGGLFVLYPSSGAADTSRIPAGRARVLLELSADRGR